MADIVIAAPGATIGARAHLALFVRGPGDRPRRQPARKRLRAAGLDDRIHLAPTIDAAITPSG